jgi:hypothetical protein
MWPLNVIIQKTCMEIPFKLEISSATYSIVKFGYPAKVDTLK